MQMDDNLQASAAKRYLRRNGLTSTAASGSPLPLEAPSTTAPTISSKYLESVKPSISLMSASAGPTSNDDLSLLSRFVCFFNEASKFPGGPGPCQTGSRALRG